MTAASEWNLPTTRPETCCPGRSRISSIARTDRKTNLQRDARIFASHATPGDKFRIENAIDGDREQTALLGPPASWSTTPGTPVTQDDRVSVILPIGAATRFYRLRGVGASAADLLTGLEGTSPVNGENGVSVTRETILRFSAPLSDATALDSTRLFAMVADRKLLSRAELSSDRKTATLFYLEPLPGSSRINVTFDGTGIKDQGGQLIDADGDGQPGGIANVTFYTLGITAVPGTAVVGNVYASEITTNASGAPVNRPLRGVTITVDGAEHTLRATTDSAGRFVLQPAPAGRFFVHIDGRTATESTYPNGDYYPFVGKAWDALPGRSDNLAGGNGQIFLPPIKAGTLQPVSSSMDTTIGFPASVVATNPASREFP
jgi:hypothetical protein